MTFQYSLRTFFLFRGFFIFLQKKKCFSLSPSFFEEVSQSVTQTTVPPVISVAVTKTAAEV